MPTITALASLHVDMNPQYTLMHLCNHLSESEPGRKITHFIGTEYLRNCYTWKQKEGYILHSKAIDAAQNSQK